ncbi:tetraspanin-6-like [Dysidea avara]|uniref:tetraspanin-6-like n=1 Tax=Dysidea avara TaxID=196820 RepID=UPI00331F305C
MEMKTCFITCCQIFLLTVNFIISCLGVVALVIGIWAASTNRDYLDISGDDKNYDSVAVLLAIVGCFILIVGAIGFIGVLCGPRMFGRILLMVYAVIVSIIILVVISGAIAGYVQKDDLKDTFRSDALRTLNRTDVSYNTKNLVTWNDAQKEVHCCGADSFHDWLPVNWSGNGTNFIPESCCATAGGCKTGKSIPYPFIGNATKVWSEGCVNAIIDKVSDQIGAVAGISVAIGVIMILAVATSCLVSILHRRSDRYELV